MQPLIWRLDEDLNLLIEVDGLTGQSFFYDAVESGNEATVQRWSGGALLTFAPGESVAILSDGSWQRVE
jgi:hypothetical protein